MNSSLLANHIENLRTLWEICKQNSSDKETTSLLLLQQLADLIQRQQPTETLENERGLSGRDACLFLRRKVSVFLTNLLSFLEPQANSDFSLAQEIMSRQFRDLRANYPEQKCHWYEIAWILLWQLHRIQTETAPDLITMERISYPRTTINPCKERPDMQQGLSLRILNILLNTHEPNLSSQEISTELKLTEQPVIVIMKVLTELGLVSRVRESTRESGRHKYNSRSYRFLYTITDAGRSLLALKQK